MAAMNETQQHLQNTMTVTANFRDVERLLVNLFLFVKQETNSELSRLVSEHLSLSNMYHQQLHRTNTIKQ